MEDSRCPVCSRNYREGATEPVMLTRCGHSFCRECLEQVEARTSSGSAFKCPTCRQEQGDTTKVTQMPVCWALLALAKDYNKINQQLESSERCLIHGDHLYLWCHDCLMRICAQCLLEQHSASGHTVARVRSACNIRRHSIRNTHSKLASYVHQHQEQHRKLVLSAVIQLSESYRTIKDIRTNYSKSSILLNEAKQTKDINKLVQISNEMSDILHLHENMDEIKRDRSPKLHSAENIRRTESSAAKMKSVKAQVALQRRISKPPEEISNELTNLVVRAHRNSLSEGNESETLPGDHKHYLHYYCSESMPEDSHETVTKHNRSIRDTMSQDGDQTKYIGNTGTIKRRHNSISSDISETNNTEQKKEFFNESCQVVLNSKVFLDDNSSESSDEEQEFDALKLQSPDLGQTARWSRVQSEEGGLHLYSLTETGGQGGLLLPCMMVQLLIPVNEPEVFLDLAVGEHMLGRVRIRLWGGLQRSQQFVCLCLGTLGPTYRGTHFSKVKRRGQPGESLNGGRYATENGYSARGVVPGLEWGGCHAGTLQPGLVGSASGGVADKESLFAICTRDGPGLEMGCPFGKVIDGLGVVMAAVQKDPVNQVVIQNAALVLKH